MSSDDGRPHAGQAPAGQPRGLPPLGPALERHLDQLAPVKTRRPPRSALWVLASGVATFLVALLLSGTRQDLGALPLWWVTLIAGVWLAGFLIPLWLVLLPARGQVLPSPGHAGPAAIVGAGALVAMGLLLTIDVPGKTMILEAGDARLVEMWWHCIGRGLALAAPVMVAAGLVLRRLFPVGQIRVAMAIGAGSGALGGLTLHLSCGIGGGLHVGFAHGGVVVASAAVAALVLSRWLRSS